MSFNSELTWPRALSAVAITWLARSVLLMAFLMLVMSLRRFSLAIKPAGSSLPVLIRKPVLNRVKRLLQRRVGSTQRVLGDQRADVCVNPRHCKPPLWERNCDHLRPADYDLFDPARHWCVCCVEGTSLSITSCPTAHPSISTATSAPEGGLALRKRRSHRLSGAASGKNFSPWRIVAGSVYAEYRPRQMGGSGS